MKKNGFIATSLLYSFFLIFCALLLTLVASYAHNRLLLNNIINNTKSELSDINNRTASKLKVGDYLKMSLFSNEKYINVQDKLWIVASINSDNTINLLSVTSLFTMYKDKDIEVMKNEPNLFYNLYTTGGDENYSHVNFITKTQLSEIEDLEIEASEKNALLNYPNEFIYYDNSSSEFYLYINCINLICNKYKNPLDDNESYPVRLSATIDKNTPISGGKGVYSDPYTLLNYINNNLILHYDYLNNTGNKGFSTNINYITDLSGTNISGQSNIPYANNKTNGITLTGNINTNLNSFGSLKNEYTIEFKSRGNLKLSTSTTSNFINSFLNSNSLYLTIGELENTFNNIKEAFTISIVKEIGNNIIIYLNGEKMNLVSTYTAPPINLNDILYINNITNFKSLRIYNKALTQEEISNNYNVDKRWSIE